MKVANSIDDIFALWIKMNHNHKDVIYFHFSY